MERNSSEFEQNFQTLSEKIKELSSVNELYGTTIVGMLSLLSSQLEGEYPKTGLENTPFTNPNQSNAPSVIE